MTRYLLTYMSCTAEDTDHEEVHGHALSLFDREGDAVASALFELWDDGIYYTDAGDWWRIDVYTYDGPMSDPDEIYETLDAIDAGEDGDVLHMHVSAEGLCIAFRGDAAVYRG